MTEKDAVKCERFADERCWYLPVRADVDPALVTRVQERIVDAKLLEILVCPVTKGPLVYDRRGRSSISRSARLAYPIRDGTPVLLEDEARHLEPSEYESGTPTLPRCSPAYV